MSKPLRSNFVPGTPSWAVRRAQWKALGLTDADLEKPKIAAVEGSEATIEAFRRLTATFYGLLSFKMPPSADELRDCARSASTFTRVSASGSSKVAGSKSSGSSNGMPVSTRPVSDAKNFWLGCA